MSSRMFTRVVLTGGLLLATAAGAMFWIQGGGKTGGRGLVSRNEPAGPRTLGEIAKELTTGDNEALAAVQGMLREASDPAPTAILASEVSGWFEVLTALRQGYLKQTHPGRAVSIEIVAGLLARLAVEPTPECWVDALTPAYELYSSALSDRSVEVRVAALHAMAKAWNWVPASELSLVEREKLAAWKENLHPLVVRRLADADPGTRTAAVACLAALPLDDAAAPAVVYLKDPDLNVRMQVLVGFAPRRNLLSEDAILPLLYDQALSGLADQVLKARGLSREQIDLGKMVFHPRADMRISAVELAAKRTDIDPVIWIVHLSRDTDESVRDRALATLGSFASPEARQRLNEMASDDPSEQIRSAAAKLLPPQDRTASLPPLPGSVSLNPKAN
jgi:hypothetical protein